MTDKEYIEKAREQYGKDGEIEIDDDAKVSCQETRIREQTQGAYVSAWLWVEAEKGEAE